MFNFYTVISNQYLGNAVLLRTLNRKINIIVELHVKNIVLIIDTWFVIVKKNGVVKAIVWAYVQGKVAVIGIFVIPNV